MASLRVEHLIEEARQLSNNTSYGSNDGIIQDLAVTLANTALNDFWRGIIKESPRAFCKVVLMSPVSGTDLYDFPTRLLLGKEIVEFRYSSTGDADDYFELNGPIAFRDRYQGLGGPTDYGFLNGQLFLSPIPNASITNGIQIYYRESLTSLDIRRGITHSDTDFNTTTLVFDTAPKMNTAGSPFDTNGKTGERDYINIVDLDGAYYVRNIRITAFDTSTGIYTIPSSWTAEAGSTDPPTGSYITRGYNASTNTPLDGEIDEFLKAKLAALMYGKNRNKAGETWAEGNAAQAKSDLLNLMGPLKQKKLMNIPGFNDVGDPYDWF